MAITRSYNNFVGFVPTKDPAIFANQSLEWAHDGVRREDSTGSFWQRVSYFAGRYLRVPASEGGGTARVIVKAARGPELQPGVFLDPALDDIQAALHVTERGLLVPSP